MSLRYARLGLQRDSNGWRIGSVELVVDTLQEAADRSDRQGAGPGGEAATGEDEG